MSELRYPNESRGVSRGARRIAQGRAGARRQGEGRGRKAPQAPARRRLKEDYVFQWANDGKVGQHVKFSELFGDKNTLLLYSFMFGPNWDKPCPSCTSLMDGFDRTWYSVTRDAAFAAIAKAPADRINAWAKAARLVADPAGVRDQSRPIRPTTSARETPTTCNGR